MKQVSNSKKGRKTYINQETKLLLAERKRLYKEKRTLEISSKTKQINRNISYNRKNIRQATFEKFISETGGVQQAYKELRTKAEWDPNVKNRAGHLLHRRPDIINVVFDFYKQLYDHGNLLPQSEVEIDSFPPSEDTKPQKILISEIDFAIKSQKN